MSRYVYRTDGAIPLDAFDTFGINAKPKTDNPFGYFGTGLKYAVAVILRHGGKFRLFVDGVEYEFYTHSKDFRGKGFQTVRMRKRKRGMLSWMKSKALPFTTELGKNWKLWQAHRELESNTRDEGGTSFPLVGEDNDEDFTPSPRGTEIVVECDGFVDVTATSLDDYDDELVYSCVFLPLEKMTQVYEDELVTIYEGANHHLYYQGVRVYDLRNPSKFTYDFKPGKVSLSEDRSAKNIWDIQWELSHAIQRMQDEYLIERMVKGRTKLWFENDDLTFYSNGMAHFKIVTERLYNTKSLGRSAFRSYSTRIEEEKEPDELAVSLTEADWEMLLEYLSGAFADLMNLDENAEDLERIYNTIKDQAL